MCIRLFSFEVVKTFLGSGTVAKLNMLQRLQVFRKQKIALIGTAVNH